MSGKKTRVSIIGTGRMARIYADLLAERPDVELGGVCGRTGEKTSEFAKRYKMKGYDGGRVADLVEANPPADAYLIATPEWVRLDPLKAVMATGKHVLVEKPLAASAGDAAELERLSPAEKARITVAHSLRFSPRFAQLEASARSGALGEIRHIYSRRNAGTESARRVLGKFDLAYWLSCHDIDLMRWILQDDVESVYAISRDGLRGEDDYLLAHIRFRKGVDALHEVSWCTPALSDHAPMARFSVKGTRGIAEVDDSRTGIDLYQPGGGVLAPDTYEVYPSGGNHYGLFASLLDRWMRTINDGAPAYPSFDDAMRAVDVGTLIMKSIRSGQKESAA